MWNDNMAVLFLMTVLVLCQCSAQNLKIDIGDTVQQHDLNKGTAEFQAPVALQWGIADTSTNVGKIFNFAIPSDAFRGSIQSIKVSTIKQVIVCVCVLFVFILWWAPHSSRHYRPTNTSQTALTACWHCLPPNNKIFFKRRLSPFPIMNLQQVWLSLKGN